MIPRVRPEILIFVVIGILEFLIAYFAYQEIVKVEDTSVSLRVGSLNELTHAVASVIQLLPDSNDLGSNDFKRGFKGFELMQPRGYFSQGNKKENLINILILDSHGKVIYDSANKQRDSDLSGDEAFGEALKTGYGQKETSGSDGEQIISVASVISGEGGVRGVVMASRSDRVLRPLIHRFQETAVLVAVAAGMAVLLLVFLIFIYFLKPIELWFAYTDLFKKGQLPAQPNLRRTRFRSLGAAIDHIYDSLSHRSYIEDLVTGLSHEMRNPLTIIRSSAESMLGNCERTPEDTIHLEDMIRHSDRMTNLITRVITVAGIEKKDYLKELKAFNFRFMIEEFIREYRSRAEDRKIKITADVTEDLVVYCDSHLLLAAIGGLIQNAMEHSPVGSTIELSAHEGPKKVEIQIRDHGTGIPDYAIDRIYEKHYSLPKETTNLKSSGLGLSFVREVAALHWGDIDIKNHPEGGVLAKLRIRRWDW